MTLLNHDMAQPSQSANLAEALMPITLEQRTVAALRRSGIAALQALVDAYTRMDNPPEVNKLLAREVSDTCFKLHLALKTEDNETVMVRFKGSSFVLRPVDKSLTPKRDRTLPRLTVVETDSLPEKEQLALAAARLGRLASKHLVKWAKDPEHHRKAALACYSKLSPQQRRERAQKAANARWNGKGG